MKVTDTALRKINVDLDSNLEEFDLDNEFHHFTAEGKSVGNKKPLWVCGKVWEYKGNSYFYIQYGDFRGGKKLAFASYDIKEQSTQFKKAHNEQIKAIEEKAKEERDKARAIGIAKWKPRFYSCKVSEVASHEYLSKKHIDQNYRARVAYNNTLLVPVESIDDDLNYTFEGVQMIFRGDDNKWVKLYNTGLNKKGAFTRVTEFDIKKTEYMYLCEGYATACSVYMATGLPTVCAFDANNLDVVIELLKKLNPDIKITIAADDDFQCMINGKQVNVGVMKATIACKKFQNVTWRKPKFASRIDETDFNDLHILEGVEVVKEQLKINRSEFNDVILLGHVDHTDFYYLCTQSKSIVSLKSSQHDGKYLKAIANEKFWAEKYGYRKNVETGEMYPDWQKISDTLLQKQRDVGVFNTRLVRGLGVWQDEGRVFVNYGNGIYKAQERVSISNIDPNLKSKMFYDASAGGELINFDDELTDDESKKIGIAIRSLNFKNPHDYVYVMGFIAIANVFGALEWRPHLWLTAPAGSGKSWIMKQLRKLIYFHIAFKRTPSVAGVEQNVNNNSLAVVIDEAEAGERIDYVVQMARESSTQDAGMSGKGSAGGKGIMYEMSACFMMASIQPPHFSEKADDSRFFIVDMNSNESQSADEFTEIEKAFKAIDGYGQRLMVRVVNNIETLRENIKVTKLVLRDEGFAAREADQLAPVIAGFFIYFSKGKIDKSIILSIMDTMQLKKSDYVERNEDKQDDRVYTSLMMLPLNNQGLTVKDALKLSMEANKTHLDLEAHGILWLEKHKGIFLASTSPFLDRKMKAINLHNFRKILERSPAFIKKNHVVRASWSASGQAKGMIIGVHK